MGATVEVLGAAWCRGIWLVHPGELLRSVPCPITARGLRACERKGCSRFLHVRVFH